MTTTTAENPRAVSGGNNPPTDLRPELALIADLYDEAKLWADGAAIDSVEMHDKMTELRTKLHDAGKAADAVRVEEKRPHDEAVKAIQDIYNPYIQPKKGKVDLGKTALDDLLAAWRRRVDEEKRAEAARIAAAAEAARIKAAEAMAASRGNLEAREEAEALVATAKSLDQAASRATKGPTGLRTTYRADLFDMAAALDHYYTVNQQAFDDLVRSLAATDVRMGKRTIPGFVIVEEKMAR